MPHLGVPELLIILVIVIVIFGVGKLPQIGSALGQSIRGFREATREGQKDEDEEEKPTARRTKKATASSEEETEDEEDSK